MTHKQQEAYKTHNTYLSVAHCPQPDSLLTDVLVSGGLEELRRGATIYGVFKACQREHSSCSRIIPGVKFINQGQHRRG